MLTHASPSETSCSTSPGMETFSGGSPLALLLGVRVRERVEEERCSYSEITPPSAVKQTYQYVCLVALSVCKNHQHCSGGIGSRIIKVLQGFLSFNMLYTYMYVLMQPSGIDDGAPLSSENGNIGHLIDDAMEDIMAPTQATPTTTPTIGHTYSASGRSQSKRPPQNKVKSSPSKSKMEIHMSGEKSVVMEFNSDSDDDDDDNILRDLMSHHRPRQNLTNGSRGGGSGGGGRRRKDLLSPTRKSMKQSGSSDCGSIFSESDEDFCVIDAPTITRVVSKTTYTHLHIISCVSTCWPSPSNQSFYRQVARYQRGVGDHRVGQ